MTWYRHMTRLSQKTITQTTTPGERRRGRQRNGGRWLNYNFVNISCSEYLTSSSICSLYNTSPLVRFCIMLNASISLQVAARIFEFGGPRQRGRLHLNTSCCRSIQTCVGGLLCICSRQFCSTLLQGCSSIIRELHPPLSFFSHVFRL